MLLRDAWNVYATLHGSGAKSFAKELCRWNKHIELSLAGMHLSEITKLTLLNFQLALRDKKLSPQSVKHCLGAILRVYRFVQRNELYDGPMPHIIPFSFDNKRTRHLSIDEAKILMDNIKIKSMLWRDISLFALFTGMRAGEIFKTRSSDISKSQIIIFDTKSGATKVCPLNSTAAAIAQKHISANKQYIFMNFYRGKWTPITKVGKPFKKAVDECGFNNKVSDRRNQVVFHTLRHTYASWLMIQGVPYSGSQQTSWTFKYSYDNALCTPWPGKSKLCQIA